MAAVNRPAKLPASARVLLVGLAVLVPFATGCQRSTATIAELEAPTPVVVEPPPEPRPPDPSPPLVYDAYAYEFTPDSDDLFAERHYTFVGAVVRVRVRYLGRPVGDVQESRFASCEAEVEAPITWHEGGFRVAQTVTARARRVGFVRTELPAEGSNRRATTDKDIRSCWVTLLAGDYAIHGQLDTTVQGRTKGFRLDEPDGASFELHAVPSATETDLIEVADDYFWGG